MSSRENLRYSLVKRAVWNKRFRVKYVRAVKFSSYRDQTILRSRDAIDDRTFFSSDILRFFFYVNPKLSLLMSRAHTHTHAQMKAYQLHIDYFYENRFSLFELFETRKSIEKKYALRTTAGSNNSDDGFILKTERANQARRAEYAI